MRRVPESGSGANSRLASRAKRAVRRQALAPADKRLHSKCWEGPPQRVRQGPVAALVTSELEVHERHGFPGEAQQLQAEQKEHDCCGVDHRGSR